MKLLKNAVVFSPKELGKKDILVAGGKILAIEDEITLSTNAPLETVDAKGKLAVPGLIDGHVHLLGGGGEGGFATRTPEISLTQITTAGVSTVVGCLGTDGTTRTTGALVAKARALTQEGVSAYALTGSYQLPFETITGSVTNDIVYINEILGTGEIAISDHRGSQAGLQELAKLVSQARVGGMLSGKAGLTVLHIGDGKQKLDLLHELLDTTELPIHMLLPTHINRSRVLLEAGIEYGRRGGWLDLTTSMDAAAAEEGEETAWDAFITLAKAGADTCRITMSSDGQGSIPLFDAQKQFAGLGIGQVASLYTAFVRLVEHGVPLSAALAPVTRNPARVLGLCRKGSLAPDMDADILLLDSQDLKIDALLCRGQWMVQAGRPCCKGAFES